MKGGIVRLERGSSGWEMIPRRLIRHPRLTWDAKFIPLWLVTGPVDGIHAPTLRKELEWSEPRFMMATRSLAGEGMWRHERIHVAGGRFQHRWTCLIDPPPDTASSKNAHLHVMRGCETVSVDEDLVALGLTHGLSAAQAKRFAEFAAGATSEQIDALRRELPIRLPGARTDRVGLAMRLAQRAARGGLDDTTREAREKQAQAARQRDQDEARTVAARRAEELERARRAREGPGPGELAAREYLARLLGGKS